jgi:hypothetical protein
MAHDSQVLRLLMSTLPATSCQNPGTGFMHLTKNISSDVTKIRQEYCEGLGSWENNNNNHHPWGRKGTLPYTLACTIKSRPSRTSPLMTNREEGEGKDVSCLPELDCPSYLCRLCTMCASLSSLRGIHPTTAQCIQAEHASRVTRGESKNDGLLQLGHPRRYRRMKYG